MTDQINAAAFNIADFEATDTAWLEVQNKKGDGPLIGAGGLPVRVEVRSPGTKEAMNAQHKVETANSARLRRHARQSGQGNGRGQHRPARREIGCRDRPDRELPDLGERPVLESETGLYHRAGIGLPR